MQQMPLKGISAIPGSDGAAHVWGSDIKLAPPYAALANVISAHVLHFDDTHTTAIVHGSTILAPTVLAIGEHLNASGRDNLTTFIGGCKVARGPAWSRKAACQRGTLIDCGATTFVDVIQI